MLRRRLGRPEGPAAKDWEEEGARLQGLCAGRQGWEWAQVRARKEREERIREEKGKEKRQKEERAGLGRLMTAMQAAQARKDSNPRCVRSMVAQQD